MTKLVHRYRNVFIVGLPGVGKTVFGRSYAAHTARSFYDLDRVIEFEQGRSIPQIFEREGEEEFREIERHTLQKLARRENSVIALGGGAFCSDAALRLLESHGLIVCLAGDPGVLAKRLLDEKDKRPLFSHVESLEEARGRLEDLLSKRAAWYDKAHLHLDLRFSSLDAAKIELSTYEERAFSPVHRHELEKLGDHLAKAPELEVHMKQRYVLQERPYLAIFSEKSSGRPMARSGSKKKSPFKKAPPKRTAKPGRPEGEPTASTPRPEAAGAPKKARRSRPKKGAGPRPARGPENVSGQKPRPTKPRS